MKKLRLKFFPKFMILMFFTSVAPLAFLGYKLIDINRLSMKRMVMQRNIALAENLAFKIDSYFAGLSKSLIFISQSQKLKEMTQDAKMQIMRVLLTSSGDIETIALVSEIGVESTKLYNPNLVKNPFYVNRSKDTEFLAAKAGGSPVLGSVYRRDGNPVINVAYPFGHEVLFLTVRLDKIFSEIENVKIDETGFAFLVDEKGRILAHPDKEIELKSEDYSKNVLVKSCLYSGSSGTSEFLRKSKRIAGSYAPVEIMKWGVITETPYSEAYHSIILMKKVAMGWIAFIIIFAATGAFFTARSITKPILSLSDVSKKIAGGNFNQSVSIKTNDELEDLAGNFNAMSRKLKIYNEMQIDKIIAEQTKTKAVIFSIFDGLILTDYEGNILLANEQAEKMLRLKTLSVGASIFNYLSTKQTELRKFFQDVISEKGKNIIREFNLSEGEYKRFAKTQTVNVKTDKNEEIGTVTVFRDITLEKEIDEMKDNFVHSITHDLKNPLTSIMGFMDLIKLKKAGDITEKQEKYLTSMQREAQRLLGMINDILDVAKLEAGKMTLNIAEINVNFLISNALESLAGTAMKKNIELKKEVPQTPVKINADGELLQRVIINLMGNSLNYTPSGGTITVSGRDLKDKVRIEVTDTGIGMPPEYCLKIFEKFQQVQGQSKGGTGLGLTISREIIRAHKGKIWAESEVGKGSRFIFEIPKGLT